MKNLSLNKIVQLVTAVLFGMVAIQIPINDPEALSAELVQSIFDKNLWAFIMALGINVLTPLYYWIRAAIKDPTQIAGSFHSTSFIISLVNIAIAALGIWGINIEPEVTQEILAAITNEEYWKLAGLVIVNILFPIMKMIFKKKESTVVVNPITG